MFASRSLPLAALALLLGFAVAVPTYAATSYSTSFESGEGYSTTFLPVTGEPFYHPGSVHEQPSGPGVTSWNENSNGGVHGEVAVTPVSPAIPPGLGTQSLYLYDRSDTQASNPPGFGASSPNQSPIVDAAGETGSYTQAFPAVTPGDTAGTYARTSDQIQAEFWFKAGAADVAPEAFFGNMSLGSRDPSGPSRRYADGHFVQSPTNAGKFSIAVQYVAGTDPDDFEISPYSAELNRNQWYRMVLSAKLVNGLAGDGSANDIVTYSAYDASDVLQASVTSTSFEVSYKYSSPGVLRTPDYWSNGIAINSFGYRLGGGPTGITPDEIGYLDNLTLISGPVPEPASLGLFGLAALVAMRRKRR